jgi:hypothetical protein
MHGRIKLSLLAPPPRGAIFFALSRKGDLATVSPFSLP